MICDGQNVKNVDKFMVLIQGISLMMLYICTNFRVNIFNGLRVIEWTRFVMDRQTDSQTTGKTLRGERHNQCLTHQSSR